MKKKRSQTFLYLLFVLPGLPGAASAQTLLYEDFGKGLYSNATVNGAVTVLYDPEYDPGVLEKFSISSKAAAPATQSLQAALTFVAPYSPYIDGLAEIMVASQYAPGATEDGGTVEPFDASSLHGALSIELNASVTTTFDFQIQDGDDPSHQSTYLTPITIPPSAWTDVVLPLDSDSGHWDHDIDKIDWSKITQVVIIAQGPPCSSPLPLKETIDYGTIEFTGSTSSSPPSVPTPNYGCPPTATPASETPSPTPSPTATQTPNAPTPTRTPSHTPSPTASPTCTPIASLSATPSPTPLKVWPNPFTPGLSPNGTAHFPLPNGHGPGQLLISNLNRRLVRSLPFQAGVDVQWDGKDDQGNLAASGVYLYLLEHDGVVIRGTVTVMR